jgi:ribonuclease P protein component
VVVATRKPGPGARLHSRAEFLAVQNGGRRVPSLYFTMLGGPNPYGHDRLGIIASRKVGGAVQRNRAKRRLREIFRRCAGTDGAALDVVVIAKSTLVDAPFALLTSDFQTALRRLRGSR